MGGHMRGNWGWAEPVAGQSRASGGPVTGQWWASHGQGLPGIAGNWMAGVAWHGMASHGRTSRRVWIRSSLPREVSRVIAATAAPCGCAMCMLDLVGTCDMWEVAFHGRWESRGQKVSGGGVGSARWAGLAWPGPACPALPWSGLVWSDPIWPGLVWPGRACSGLV